MIDLREAAIEYQQWKLPITLCRPGSKKPLGKRWTGESDGADWQNKRWTLKEIDDAFDQIGNCNVGLVLGKRSGIVDIECDGAEAERTFSELFKGCEPVVVPTFQSRRGKHRLFASHPELETLNTAVINIGMLQILIGGNGKAAHCLLPPSETDDFERRWLVSFEECAPPQLPPEVISRILAAQHLHASMSTPSQLPDSKQHSLQLHHWQEHRNKKSRDKYTEAPEDTDNTGTLRVCQGGSFATEEAIRRTIPTGPGQRHRMIFELCRFLKAMPEYANAEPSSLRPIVKEWYRQALRFIRTKEFEVTWADFLDSFPRVEYPAGKEPIASIYQESQSKPLPSVAERYESEPMRRLVALCAELQRQAGQGQPFFLACRTAGELLDVGHGDANKLLRLLQHDKVLLLVEKGRRHHASTFVYTGDYCGSTAA